jgi:group I intron endonuclease
MTNRRDLKKQYRQNPPEIGIYQIRNKVNGKIFIGSAKNLKGILNSNRFQLKMGSHFIKELQEDYKKYGEDNFEFEKIDSLELKDDINYDYTKDLETLEEMWLEKIKPFDEKGYNSKKIKT